MARELGIIRLTDHQKKVLVRVMNAATEVVAGTEAGRTTQLATARDMLTKLGLIDFDGKKASVTDKGNEVMQDEGLVDDSGTLTNDGNKFLSDEEDKEGGEDTSLMQDVNQAAGPMGGTPPSPMGTPPPV